MHFTKFNRKEELKNIPDEHSIILRSRYDEKIILTIDRYNCLVRHYNFLFDLYATIEISDHIINFGNEYKVEKDMKRLDEIFHQIEIIETKLLHL